MAITINGKVFPTKSINIDRSKIYPNPDQPRKVFSKGKMKELKNSIMKNKGIAEPLLVEYDGDDGYTILDGERRWRVCEELNTSYTKSLPCNVILDKLNNEDRIRTWQTLHIARKNWSEEEIGSFILGIVDKYGLGKSVELLDMPKNKIVNLTKAMQLAKKIDRDKPFEYAKTLILLEKKLKKDEFELVIRKVNNTLIPTRDGVRKLSSIFADPKAKKLFMKEKSSVDDAYFIIQMKRFCESLKLGRFNIQGNRTKQIIELLEEMGEDEV